MHAYQIMVKHNIELHRANIVRISTATAPPPSGTVYSSTHRSSFSLFRVATMKRMSHSYTHAHANLLHSIPKIVDASASNSRKLFYLLTSFARPKGNGIVATAMLDAVQHAKATSKINDAPTSWCRISWASGVHRYTSVWKTNQHTMCAPRTL